MKKSASEYENSMTPLHSGRLRLSFGLDAAQHKTLHRTQTKETTMFWTHLSATSHKRSGRIAYFGLAVLYTFGLLTAFGTMTSQIL
jgi:hypothetical protein